LFDKGGDVVGAERNIFAVFFLLRLFRDDRFNDLGGVHFYEVGGFLAKTEFLPRRIIFGDIADRVFDFGAPPIRQVLIPSVRCLARSENFPFVA